ncbi:MAG: lysostaphin resistance A-like protein [Pleurocapsa sp.]
MAYLPAPVRLLIFTGVLLILWLPLAIPIYLEIRHNSNLATIVTMALLFVDLLGLWYLWGKYVYQEANIFTRYGLSLTAANQREFLKGLAIGLWFCLSLFIVEAVLGWVEIATPEVSTVQIVAEGLLSALGIALAEELVFRGWILDELQRDYGDRRAIFLSALLFAVLHFLKPIAEIIRTLVTFPALLWLGIILAIAKQRHGDRLGICIGIHGGLVWGYYMLNVGQLIEYTNKVPVWITGIDGNPIAGMMGLIFLSIMAIALSRKF